MTNAQRPNKHRRTKSKKATTTKGSRGKLSVFKHGRGKGHVNQEKKKKK